MHKNTARVIGVACVAIGLLRLVAGYLLVLGWPFTSMELAPFPDGSLSPFRLGPWSDVATLPAAAALLLGGLVLVRGQLWGRYLALAYPLFNLGLALLALVGVVGRSVAFSDVFSGGGSMAVYLGLNKLAELLPSVFLLVMLAIPSRNLSHPAEAPVEEGFALQSTARAEIVRIGWLSVSLGGVGLAMMLFEGLRTYRLALPPSPGANPAALLPSWLAYSLGGYTLASALQWVAGVGLLRFRRGSIVPALIQGVLGAALLALMTYVHTGMGNTKTGVALAGSLFDLIWLFERHVPAFLVAALVCLPHIRGRLGRAGRTLDGQPILDESEMPPVA